MVVCLSVVSLLQRSVLGPLLYLLYTADVFDIKADCGLVGHSYADDTQVYISVPAADASIAMQRLAACVGRIDEWMGSNRLWLNQDKTQLIWIGTRQQLSKMNAAELALPPVNNRQLCLSPASSASICQPATSTAAAGAVIAYWIC